MHLRTIAFFTACSIPLLAACSGGDESPTGGAGGTHTGSGGAPGGGGGSGGAPLFVPRCGEQTGAGAHVASVFAGGGLRAFTFEVTMSAEIDCAANANPKLSLSKSEFQKTTPVELGPATCGGNPTVFTFSPKVELDYTGDYLLVVDGLVDQEGAAIPSCGANFKTKSKTVAVSSGAGVHASLDDDGSMWTWGDPLSAVMDGRPRPATIPLRATLPEKVVSMSVGSHFIVAALANGQVYAWGVNNLGQLGDGTKAPSGSTPVKVGFVSGVQIAQVSASADHALALGTDGGVYAWGHNDSGQLGDGTQTDSSLPLLVSGVANAVAIAAGRGSSGNGAAGGHSLALAGDGVVWGWGANNYGNVGVAPEGSEQMVPVQATGVPTAKQLSSGSNQGYVVTFDGKGIAWGRADLGALGNGTCQIAPASLAGPISGSGGTGQLDNLLGIDGGHGFAIAVRKDGTVWGWGDNLQGQLGDGTTGGPATCPGGSFDVDHSRIVPVQATGVANAVAASAGPAASLVVLADGSVLAAGDNTNMALGLPAPSPVGPVTTFTKVPGL